MKKRFILLVDETESPENLIRYSSQWAIQASAELLIVHEPSILIPSFTDSESKKALIEEIKQEEESALKELTRNICPPGLTVHFLLSLGNLQLTISQILEEENYQNLILVGIKKIGLLEKLISGSVALQIIENTHNIVVALPSEIDHYSHEKIMVAISEHHPFNILEFNNLLKFIDPKDTLIDFFYLAKPNEPIKAELKQLKELKELFEADFNTNYHIYEGRDPFNDIKAVINDKIDEILVVQKGSRLLTDQLFRKFLVNELVYEGQTPLIVLP